MKVFGFVGLKGAGKTASATKLAMILRDEHKTTVLQTSFASAMKTSLAQELEIDVTLLNDPATKSKYRLQLQLHGDKLREQHGDDVFVEVVAKQIQAFAGEHKGEECAVVIDDVRYLREAQFIQGFDSHKIWRVIRTRDGVTRIVDDYEIDTTKVDDDKDEHSSETEQLQIKVDATLMNGSQNKTNLRTALRFSL
jgi:molybdopterin-guanine dinucleotide biosynthesis protein